MKLKAGQFYGQTSQTLAANGFRFTEKSYMPQAALPPHSHELSHFCFVLAGIYREKISRNEFERSPATLIFYPPDVSHAEEHVTSGRHFLVEIDMAGLDNVREYGARFEETTMLADESSRWLAVRMYREFCERDRFSPLALESISTELLIAGSRTNEVTRERQPPRWLATAKELLKESLISPPGLNALAQQVGVHPTHFARVFRQFERCTAGDYVRKTRVEYAWRQILATDTPLIEIALNAGFADQAHFARSFKRTTGLTPTEFRRTFKTR